MREYNSIHRQQLFYWTGRGFEVPALKRTAAKRLETRLAYVDRLKSILQKGIWLKTPDKPDQLGDGTLIKITRPIACFTEWALGQSLAHTTEYGRLGFGFPKRFILSKGGQPVIYARDAVSNSRYVEAFLEMARILSDESSPIPSNLRKALWKNFDFVSHFVKAIQKPIPSRKKGKSKPFKPLKKYEFLSPDKALDGLVELALAERERGFKRKFGRFLHYLEEREWRIVYDTSLKKKFAPGPGGNDGPECYLRFKPGSELFTVVVPDNLTLNMVMQDNELRETLFPKDGLPVTLLSFEDIGTF